MSAKTTPNPHYDVVIIGAGATGAGTARETEHQLLAHGLRSAAAGRGTVTLENSLDDAREHALSELLFALPENR